MDLTEGRTGGLSLKHHCKMNNDQLAISIKSLNILANFDMLILQFALIFEKELGREHSLASAITSPGKKVAEDISKARMIPKGTDALSPAL